MTSPSTIRSGPTATAPADAPVLERLSTLDRFLPLWIFAAMALGLLLGRVFPGLGAALDRVKVAGVSVPIGFGLLWMMYPVLAKDSILGWLFLNVVPGWFGAEAAVVNVSMWAIARSVLIFLGIPLFAGYITRLVLVARRGESWYTGSFMPRFGPTALVGLLYTIVLMFAMQGDRILALPIDVLRIALPMVVYFFVMFGLAFVLSAKLGFGYEETASLSFTAAGNNFELAIAVAVATFGISSGEALAAVVGPLIEVPVLVGLVYVSLWARRRYFTTGELHALRADL